MSLSISTYNTDFAGWTLFLRVNITLEFLIFLAVELLFFHLCSLNCFTENVVESANFLGRFQPPVALFSLVLVVVLLLIGFDTFHITTFFVQAFISILILLIGFNHVGACDLFIFFSLPTNHQCLSDLPLFILSCSTIFLSTLQSLEALYFHLFFNKLNFFPL